MAQRGPDPTGKRKDKIKENERRIKELEEEKENCGEKIRDLEKEIKRLQAKNDSLEKEIKELKIDVIDLKEGHDFQVNKYTELNEEVKILKMSSHVSEDQLCIGQLCTNLQQNMCKLTLRDHYDNILNTNIKDMDDYISFQIEDKTKQQEARKRWEKLKKELDWKDYLSAVIAGLKKGRNEVAHPPDLTNKKITTAKTNLLELEKISINMAKGVDTLTNMLEITNVKLQKVPRARQQSSSARKADEKSQHAPLGNNIRSIPVTRQAIAVIE